VKALSPCKIWRMEKSKLHDFYNLSFSFNKLARIHLERSIIHKIERENGFHTLSAEERYKRLLETERWLLQYFSLKDIASYLGITPQALSNVRKRI
ncbi:Crp/Fnr family transcriptional regulator, partial [Bacteroides nordii]